MDSLLSDTSSINIGESEANFQKAFDNYWHTDVTKHDESYYKAQMDIMWMCVYYACANICKSVYKHRCVIVDDLEDVIMDAIHTIYRYYEKDPGVLIRFCQVIQRMGVINGI